MNTLKTYTLLFITIPLLVYSQTNEITVKNLWDGTFSQERLEKLTPLSNGKQYTVLKTDWQENSSEIHIYDYLSGEKTETLLSSKTSISTPFFTSYTFSKEENKLLLETDVTYIYRRSKEATYWVYDITSKKSTLLFDKKVQAPKFSPDGSKVAFVYERNLYVKNLEENTIEQVTSDGSKHIINGLTDWVYEEEFGIVRAFDWNADSSSIAFLRFDESKVPEFSMDVYGKGLYPYPYKFKYPKAGEENATLTLFHYDLTSKKIKTIELGEERPYYIPRIKFSPETNILTVQTMNRLQNHLQLWKVDVSELSASVILEEKDEAYVDIHDNLTFLADNSFLWTSDRSGYNHIYHFTKNGKLINQLTKGDWEVVKFIDYNPESKEIYYTSVEKNTIERVVYAIGLKGKNKRVLSNETGTNGAVFSADFSSYIHIYSDAKTPSIYTLRDTKTTKSLRVIEDNEELKSKLKTFKTSPKEFSTITINDESLNMWMVKPADFDPSKKYPLLLFQYSGPGSQQVANQWLSANDFWHNMLAQKGFIVACVDGRGTGFKGAKFKKMTYQKLAHYETLDQIEVAKQLGQKEYIDETKIGIWGWSYGGLMSTNSILKGNDVFSFAIAVAPVTDWRFYDTIYTERFMRTPQENPEGYDDNSPINFADRLKGDFLLIHGSGDDNVHVQNTMRMVEALIQADKQFEWMIYPDKNHGIYGGNTRNHLYTKMTEFLLEKL